MKNWIGHKFGILTVLEQTSRFKFKRKSRIYICKCECGNITEVPAAQFSTQQSCGCLKRHPRHYKEKIIEVEKEINKLIVSVINQYKYSAKRRKLCFKLTNNEIKELIFKKCKYCNKAPFLNKTSKKDSSIYINYNGIDRINNQLGYIFDNCVTCCKFCNQAKGTMTLNEFYSWIIKLNKVLNK
jgi:hypothetical protein